LVLAGVGWSFQQKWGYRKLRNLVGTALELAANPTFGQFGFTSPQSRLFGHLLKTQIDLNRSMNVLP